MYLISFVVPLYNKERFIKRCLKSICRQRGNDIQIIVVDDGSTDESKDIVFKFKEKDKRIEYFYQDNGGAKARNSGIKLSKGKWITFIDADDFISKHYMDTVREYLDDKVDCFVLGNYIKNNKILRSSREKRFLCKDWNAGNAEFMYEYLCGKSVRTGTSVWDKIFKREILEKNKLVFLPLKIGEDALFCFDYAMYSHKWRGIPHNLYYYVQEADSVMHECGEENINAIDCLMDAYDELGRRWGIYEQLRPAIGCTNVRDIFTILKMISRMYSNVWDQYRSYRNIVNDVYYRGKIQWVDKKKIDKKYRVVYILLKYKMSISIMILVKLYHMVYKL